MEKRKKIKVKRLKLTSEQIQNARIKALEGFNTLVVWKDSKATRQQKKKEKEVPA